LFEIAIWEFEADSEALDADDESGDFLDDVVAEAWVSKSASSRQLMV
jgi:hypothetical protein